METIHLRTTVQDEGEIHVVGLPFKRGERVDLVLTPSKRPLTARQLLHSGLIGLWAGRADIADSAVFSRRLREQAQRRQRE